MIEKFSFDGKPHEVRDLVFFLLLVNFFESVDKCKYKNYWPIIVKELLTVIHICEPGKSEYGDFPAKRSLGGVIFVCFCCSSPSASSGVKLRLHRRHPERSFLNQPPFRGLHHQLP